MTVTVNPMLLAEAVVRDLMSTHPELPIRAEFYRGRSRYEVMTTPAVTTGWYVLAKPTLHDVVLSAIEPTPLGWGIVGGLGDDAEVTAVKFPAFGGDVDREALTGPEFGQELLAAVRAKAAVIDEARAAA